MQQNKRIKENMKTVRNSHRTEGLLVDTDKRKEGKRGRIAVEKNKKQKASGKSKIRIGRKIDTKI